MKPKAKVIAILLKILANPYIYTRKDLMKQFGINDIGTINDYINAIREVGLTVDNPFEQQYRLAILPDRNFKELSHLQPLSDSDKALISRALDHVSGKDKLYLRKKLESIYDFQKLGLRALRKPALERIDRLLTAKRQKRQVVLENYRSRSNNIKDRIVEPFLIDPELDTLQAYDVEARDSRHYRLSRIERVVSTEASWQYTNSHQQKITDVFRIADNEQEFVHLTLDVFAYNSLTEEFPLTRTYIESGSEPNTFDFQCRVNHEFKGLLNFLMSNAMHVHIHSPEQLREKMIAEAETILKKMQP
jgi:predicted DNA-binding transcriptional regulator YafY